MSDFMNSAPDPDESLSQSAYFPLEEVDARVWQARLQAALLAATDSDAIVVGGGELMPRETEVTPSLTYTGYVWSLLLQRVALLSDTCCTGWMPMHTMSSMLVAISS